MFYPVRVGRVFYITIIVCLCGLSLRPSVPHGIRFQPLGRVGLITMVYYLERIRIAEPQSKTTLNQTKPVPHRLLSPPRVFPTNVCLSNRNQYLNLSQSIKSTRGTPVGALACNPSLSVQSHRDPQRRFVRVLVYGRGQILARLFGKSLKFAPYYRLVPRPQKNCAGSRYSRRFYSDQCLRGPT